MKTVGIGVLAMGLAVGGTASGALAQQYAQSQQVYDYDSGWVGGPAAPDGYASEGYAADPYGQGGYPQQTYTADRYGGGYADQGYPPAEAGYTGQPYQAAPCASYGPNPCSREPYPIQVMVPVYAPEHGGQGCCSGGGHGGGAVYEYHGFWKYRGPNIPIGCPRPRPQPGCGHHGGGERLPASFFYDSGGVGPAWIGSGGGGGGAIVYGGGSASASAYASARASVHVSGGFRGGGKGHHGGKRGCCR